VARFDLFQGGNRVPMTVEDDPDNVGQYVLPGARALGTPGTGEPAHAGGSTGVIGWLRDILASNATAAYYTDTTTPLAAGAYFVGSTRTMAIGNHFFSLQVQAQGSSSAANGCRIQKSSDGATWFHCIDDSLIDGKPVASVARRTTGFYRVFYINGGSSPQVTFSITSSQTPN